MSTILKRDDPLEMTVAGFKLGKVGVTVDGTPSLEDWQTAMQLVQRCNSASLWWIGDLLKEGEARYGDLASQEDGDGKYDYQTLADAKYVACRIPFSDRSEKLGFLHHKIIAPLSEKIGEKEYRVTEDQREWLRRAAEEGWSAGRLRSETADARSTARLKANPLPLGKYHVLYADPPWRYDFAQSDNRQIENQYPTMSLEQICELKPPAADDAVLFLWATSPKLQESMAVIEAWGFTYKTCMVWVKDKIGMGYYARQRHELLLVCGRGSLGEPPTDARPDSVIESPRGEHSAKPDVFYGIIERLYPKAKKLELFQRRKRAGWVGWGDQAPQV